MELIQEDNKIVHGLWVGNQLSAIELLTLHSFTSFGHTFYLWTYEPLQNDLPKGVLIKDANEIIPANKIFYRKFDDPACGVGKGSVGSPFSDLFRYTLLYEKGGWWTDMDITLLKPLNSEDSYFFRAHDKLPVIGNILKVPPRSELMKKTSFEVLSICNENTLDWLLPNKILSKNIKELGLTNYINSNISNNDIWPETRDMIKYKIDIPKHWLFIHWMNEEWRKRKINKNKFYKNTFISGLLDLYSIDYDYYSFFRHAIRIIY